jgi:hypothetical protein
LLAGELGRQRSGNSGFITEAKIYMGCLLAHRELAKFDLLPEPEYSSHLIQGVDFGLDWNFAKKTQIPFSLLFLPHVNIQTPYKTKNILRIRTNLKISYMF